MTEEELRRQAMLRYEKAEDPKSIYTDLGRTKQWFLKWLKRYRSGDPDWYRSRSHATRTRPTRTSNTERSHIINIRRQLDSQRFAQVGVSAIKWELHKAGHRIPSDSTIYRVLKHEGLIKKNCVHPQRCRISVFHRSALPKQHPPSRSGRPKVHQGRWALLLAEHHRCGHPSGLHPVSAKPGRPTGRLQPFALLEGYRDAGFPSVGQRPHVQRQQSASTLVRTGDPAVPALWHHPGVYPHRGTLAKRRHRKL